MLTLNNLINIIEPNQIEFKNKEDELNVDTYKIIVNKKENIEKLNKSLFYF